MPVREQLTVIITTSAIRSHPSMEMIARVRASFGLIEGLIDCPQIIVADGVSIAEKSELKKGRVTAALAARYSQYLQLLRDVLEAEAAQLQVQRLLIVREKRYGYAENLKHALQTCRTSHVLVVQHDQSILRPLQETRIDQIVQLLSSEPQVRCIGLMGTMDRDYERRFYHFPKYKLFMEDWNRIILDFVRRLPDGPLRWAALKQSREEDRSKLLLYTELRYGLPMMPIDFWYDKPHVTKTQTYLEFIFGQTHFNYESGTSVAVSNFVEDSVGHVVKSACRRHGHLGWAQFGTFTLYVAHHLFHVPIIACGHKKCNSLRSSDATTSSYDAPAPLVGHVDGRSFVTREMKEALQYGAGLCDTAREDEEEEDA